MASASNGSYQPTIYAPPRVFTSSQANTLVKLQDLFTATDPHNYDITWYRFSFNSTGGSYIINQKTNTKYSQSNQKYEFQAADLPYLCYYTGNKNTNSTIAIEASHGYGSYGQPLNANWHTNATVQPVVKPSFVGTYANNYASFNGGLVRAISPTILQQMFSLDAGQKGTYYKVTITNPVTPISGNPASANEPGHFRYLNRDYKSGDILIVPASAITLPESDANRLQYISPSYGSRETVNVQASTDCVEFGPVTQEFIYAEQYGDNTTRPPFYDLPPKGYNAPSITIPNNNVKNNTTFNLRDLIGSLVEPNPAIDQTKMTFNISLVQPVNSPNQKQAQLFYNNHIVTTSALSNVPYADIYNSLSNNPVKIITGDNGTSINLSIQISEDGIGYLDTFTGSLNANNFTSPIDINKLPSYKTSWTYNSGFSNTVINNPNAKVTFYCDDGKAVNLGDGKPVYVYTAGWKDSGIPNGPVAPKFTSDGKLDPTDTTSQNSAYMYDALRQKLGDTAHVIVTDWKYLANPATTQVNDGIYPSATSTVTYEVGEYLAGVLEQCGAKPENIHLIGHSLGSFVSMAAAQTLKDDFKGRQINELVALDPARGLGAYNIDARGTGKFHSPPDLSAQQLSSNTSAYVTSAANGIVWSAAGDKGEAGTAPKSYLVSFNDWHGVNSYDSVAPATGLHGEVVSAYADLFRKGMTTPEGTSLPGGTGGKRFNQYREKNNNTGTGDKATNIDSLSGRIDAYATKSSEGKVVRDTSFAFNGVVLAGFPFNSSGARLPSQAIGWMGDTPGTTTVYGSNNGNNLLFSDGIINYANGNNSVVQPLNLIGGNGASNRPVINNFVPGRPNGWAPNYVDTLTGSSVSYSKDIFWLGYYDGIGSQRHVSYNDNESQGWKNGSYGTSAFAQITGFSSSTDRIVLPLDRSKYYVADVTKTITPYAWAGGTYAGIFETDGKNHSDLIAYLPGISTKDLQGLYNDPSSTAFAFNQYADLVNGSSLPGLTNALLSLQAINRQIS